MIERSDLMITVKVNNSSIYQVANWDSQNFQSSLQITLKTIDLVQVRLDFEHIERLEIFQNDYAIASYSSLDTFSEITYIGTIFDQETKSFSDCIRLTLTRTNIAEQVQRLDNQINPVIDIEGMTLEEYKQYRRKELSEATTAAIYAGSQVTLTDGTVEMFSFDNNDQKNLIALSSIAMMDPEFELSWHSNGHLCRMYSGYDIINIYQTLFMKLVYETTVCNALNGLIHAATTKEEVDYYYYGCPLPETLQAHVANIMARMLDVVNRIKGKIMPPVEPDDEPDDGQDPENPEPVNPEPENSDPEDN